MTFIGERSKAGNLSLNSKLIIGTTFNAPMKNIGCYIIPIREIKTTDENLLGTLLTIVIHCDNSEYSPDDFYENLLEWIKEHINAEFHIIV